MSCLFILGFTREQVACIGPHPLGFISDQIINKVYTTNYNII